MAKSEYQSLNAQSFLLNGRANSLKVEMILLEPECLPVAAETYLLELETFLLSPRVQPLKAESFLLGVC